jgi:hypothetical protein
MTCFAVTRRDMNPARDRGLHNSMHVKFMKISDIEAVALCKLNFAHCEQKFYFDLNGRINSKAIKNTPLMESVQTSQGL